MGKKRQKRQSRSTGLRAEIKQLKSQIRRELRAVYHAGWSNGRSPGCDSDDPAYSPTFVRAVRKLCS